EGERALVRRVSVAGYGLGYYLRKTVWPGDLSAYHYRPARIDPAEPRFAASLAAVAVGGTGAWLLRRRQPAVAAASLSYAALLAPNLGLVSYDLMLVADRYAYVATMPWFVLAAGGLVRGVAGSRRPVALTLAILST